MTKLKIAAIQMCSSNNVDDNLKTAARLIKEAALHDAKLIVLPEMFAIMGKTPEDKIVVKENFGVGKIQDFLSQQARINKLLHDGKPIEIKYKKPSLTS